MNCQLLARSVNAQSLEAESEWLTEASSPTRALLIDSEPSRTAIARVLAEAGFEIETVAASADVAGFLEKEHFDLILFQANDLKRTLEKGEAVREELVAQLGVATAKIAELTTVDPSTGLLNRKGLEGMLAAELQRAKRNQAGLIALHVRLLGLKRIHDALGHSSRDVVIREAVKAVKASIRSTDHIGRIGEAQILVLLPEVRVAEGARVAERLRLRLTECPLELTSGSFPVDAEVRLAEVPFDVVSVDDLLSRTDLASEGPVRSNPVRRESEGASSDIRSLSFEIAQQLRRGEGIRAVCQPILRLEDESIDGYEMLARGPAGPFESPKDFLRVALQENMLQLVDRHCLRACLAAATTMNQRSRFHVNLFPTTLLDTPPQALLNLFALEESEATYCVEVSEQQILGDPSYLSVPVHVLRESGIHIAIDDVGFGRSCLESLIVLEPDIVKIDRKYVNGLSDDAGKARSLKRLLQVAESLGAEVIAEGIEQRSDLDELKRLGVRYGQGFLWGKPTAPGGGRPR
jgi:diguanylate cyclase (GGDEF)-like protein